MVGRGEANTLDGHGSERTGSSTHRVESSESPRPTFALRDGATGGVDILLDGICQRPRQHDQAKFW